MKMIQIPEHLFVDIFKFLESLDVHPDYYDPDDLHRILPEIEDKMCAITRRHQYSASLSADSLQGRNAPVDMGKQDDG